MHLIPNETYRRGVYPPAPTAMFSVWQTIKLGTHKTVVELAKAAAAQGHWIVDSALDLMAQPVFPLAQTVTETDLVSVSVGELGFSSGSPCGWIYERARQLGLRLCPPEVGPQLLLQRRGRLGDPFLWVAMAPIANAAGRLGAFALTDGENNNRWLVWHSGNHAAVCPSDFRFVFVLPREHFGAAVRHLGLNH